jgi:hypothetical protein
MTICRLSSTLLTPLGETICRYVNIVTRFQASISVSRPIRVAARSKAWVCGLSLAGISGSNPAGGMDVLSLVSVSCCQVEALQHTNLSSREVLPSVVCLSVI